MMETTLSPIELLLASQVGVTRKVSNIQNNVKDLMVSTKEGAFWNIDIDGAAAELAVAKCLNIYWNPSTKPTKDSDVGRYQVRATTHKNGNLILRERDVRNEKYILVTHNSVTFTLVGWTWLNDAKIDQYLVVGADGKSPSWWVPQSALKPMSTIND